MSIIYNMIRYGTEPVLIQRKYIILKMNVLPPDGLLLTTLGAGESARTLLGHP